MSDVVTVSITETVQRVEVTVTEAPEAIEVNITEGAYIGNAVLSTNIRYALKLTQAAYDAIVTPDATTLYIII